MREINYDHVANVMTTWEKLRTTSNYETEAGTKLYKHFFNRCPEAKQLFDNWTAKTSGQPVNAANEDKYIQQGILMIQTIDSTLGLLGIDTEALTETLLDMGTQHESYGVKPHMYPMMQLAICDAMEDILGNNVMTYEMKESWSNVMEAFAEDMVTAQEASWRAGAFEDH